MSEPQPDVPRDSARAVLLQFVVFPLLVVAVGVFVFLLFGALATERDDIDDHLAAIRSGSSHRRWQAAYQLAMAIQRGEAVDDPEVATRVLELYREADDDDPRVRRYLAMVLGRLGDPRAIPLLLESLEAGDLETRIYAILALAEIGDPAAADPIAAALASSDDPDLRKAAAYALGRLGSRAHLPQLRAALRDPVPDVRFNAALALAALGDSSGIGVLRRMLDRDELARVPGIREDQKEAILVQAIPAYALLAGEEARPLLESLASSDPSLKVRAAATEALNGL
ncbi:MAG TPA: HEAT repeat domain-containing protein [Thermoanaerobaculia bacterium]|nr:HEAT repeat domain-containing protein [Thermoanaerobaculia bacterium]